MQYECDNLDAYLDDELPSDAALRFESHLATCESCREAIDEQHWIEGLLRSPARVELEQPPAALCDSFRTSLIRSQWQTRLVACGFAAAAALVVAAGWTVVLNRQATDTAIPELAIVAPGDDENEPIAAPIPQVQEAFFVGGPNVIAVPVESRHPDVTIVRIYSTYQPDAADQAVVAPTDGDDFAWPSPFSGGS